MESNNQEIEKQAKQILDKFAKALEKVDSKEIESYVDRTEFQRKEDEGRNYDSNFKKRILENAPAKDEDFIITEKGSWK